MADVKLKILAPWTIAIRKIEALFDGDPQIACNVNYASSAPRIVLACNNGDKVAALQKILPEKIQFGNVALEVGVDGVPSNRAFATKKELFETAFAGNPCFAGAFAPAEEGYNWFTMTYVIFKNCVVQFFADNINDAHGVISTLYQDIAEDILAINGNDGVYFCTDIERGNLGKSLGEWP